MFAPMDTSALSADRILQTSSMFRTLDAAGRQELAARARTLHVDAGAVIFKLGDPGHSMMAVLQGSVRISIPGPAGKDIVLADLTAGNVFGEIAVLDSGPRTATATALQKTALLVFDRREVQAFLRKRADFCVTLLELLATRLRRSDERIAQSASASAR